MSEEKIEFKSGLTKVSMMAVMYAAVIMTPVIIFMALSTGLTDPARFIPVFVTLLLFTEVGRYVGRYISTQEAYIIYFMAELVAFESLYFQGLLMGLYYREAPYTKLFGIADKIPTWVAPPLDAYAVRIRTFIAPEWALPLAVSLLGTLAGILVDIGLSFLFIQLYIETEKLPFPIAPIDAQAISTLTERSPQKITIFSLAAVISFFYEFILYGLPAISEVLMGTRVTFIPYPWIDLTNLFEIAVPGAIFGIATDISTFAVGWVIPFNSVIWILIGSISFFIIGNFLALKIPHPLFKGWQEEWVPGQSVSWIWQRSVYNLWASPRIGITLALGIFSVIVSAKAIIKSIKSLRRLSEISKAKGYLSLPYILLLIVSGAAIGIAIDLYLYPQLWFVWVVLWTVIPFIQGVLLARSYGEVGLGVQIPYVKEAFMLAFTAPGDPAPWMVPAKITTSAGIITHRIKVAMLTKTRPIDYFKATVIALPLIIFLSFIYWQIFWSMAKIPSSFYPWTGIQWPIASLNFSLWVSRSIVIFKPDVIIGWLVIILVVSLIARYFKLPFSPIGFAAGTGLLPHFAINYFIGALLGRYLSKKIGKEKWEMYRSVILAGLFAGLGLAVAVSVAVTVIFRSIWSTPF